MLIWLNYLPLTAVGRVQPHASAPGISGATSVIGRGSSVSTSGWPFVIFRHPSVPNLVSHHRRHYLGK